MGKAAAIIGSVLSAFLLVVAAVLELISSTPFAELPEDIQEGLGYLRPPSYSNDVDGITWLTPIHFDGVSSPFGWRIHPIYGDFRLHAGIDLSAAQGTPIRATRDGVVITAGYNDSSGNHVILQHDDVFRSAYLHMDHFIVSVGDTVTQGQIIGYVGSTGASTGPHLHFSIYYEGKAIDPAEYIALSPPEETTPAEEPAATE